ncbi:MAG TPA: UpxY family transcription antiterminator [Terriglobia bacterium]|nr:UpxY family transcription antiterminator [Terriglobia bacterium]
MGAAEEGIVNVAVADPAWYALYTRHQHEKTVARVLASKGFETFLPLYATAHRWKDRTKQISLPLFPCYVFLSGDTRRRTDILGTPGVHSLVGSEGRPAPISQSEVDTIRQMVESRMQVEPHPFLRCGDWIRVKSGPLTGIEGILVRKKNLFRLVVSVELLQKSVAVEVDVSTVERASRPAWAGVAGAPSRVVPAFL